ncbi:MAG: YjfB family protein [Mariprofundaceae bacterium]|nr:YjfB family protein [Mariprofundaceae bacterium]
MDMGLVAVASAMSQASVQSNVQQAVLKENLDVSKMNAAKLLQAMPSIDANPAIGKTLNVVA